MLHVTYFCICFGCFVSVVFSANILSIFPTPSKSHWILAQPLLQALVRTGHKVTVISSFPLKHPPTNYTDIELTGLMEYFEENMEHAYNSADETLYQKYSSLFRFANYLTNFTLQHENVKKLLNATGVHYDLLFLETFLDDALLGFAHHFNCPVVAMSTMGITCWINDWIGSPQSLSHAPHLFLPYTDSMGFWQRVHNLAIVLMERWMMRYMYFPQQTKMYEQSFGGPKPGLDQLRRTSVSLALLNSHFSVSFPRAYMPNMIEVAGMHIKSDRSPLPSDIKRFIDAAPGSVIYFSMGGNLTPSKMPADKLKVVISVFSKLNLRVLWKFDNEELEVDREKVLIKRWYPQDDVLAHPKVLLFITHGGLLSCTEALYHGVPLLGIPIFGDQQTNMERAAQAGWALRLDFTNLTVESFEWSIQETLTNQIYLQRARELSRRFRDQPKTALATAQYWVEYVLRNQGADYIKSASQNLTVFEYYNLDIALAALSIAITIFYINVVIIKRIVRLAGRAAVKRQGNKEKVS